MFYGIKESGVELPEDGDVRAIELAYRSKVERGAGATVTKDEGVEADEG